jgi:hypothetical protein
MLVLVVFRTTSNKKEREKTEDHSSNQPTMDTVDMLHVHHYIV